MFNIGVCHEDMTGKRGGECCRNEYECHWNEYTPCPMEFLCFGRKIPSLLNFDDVIMLHH